MALNRSDKSRILRRYFPGMTRNSEMSTEPSMIRGKRTYLCILETSCSFPSLSRGLLKIRQTAHSLTGVRRTEGRST